MKSTFRLYEPYNKDQVILLLREEGEVTFFYEETFALVSGKVFCFLTLDSDLSGAHLSLPDMLIWKPFLLKKVKLQDCPFLEMMGSESPGRLFLRRNETDPFLYLGEVYLSSYSHSLETGGLVNIYLSFFEPDWLPKPIWVYFGEHDGWTLIARLLWNSEQEEIQHLRLTPGENIQPYLDHLAQSQCIQHLTLTRWEGGMFEVLIMNEHQACISCMLEEIAAHSQNPAYDGPEDSIVEFYWQGEMYEAEARSVISKSSALEALGVFITTGKLADSVQWANGNRP